MTFKFISFFALMAIAAAGQQHYPAQHHFEHKPVISYHEHENPIHYDFSYSVHDDQTKDIKSRMESRKDDMVKGHYDMIDSDGYKRIVDYTADDKNGFQAMVHREKTDIHVPTPTVAYHQNQYYHNTYPEHSLEHHHMALPVHSAEPNKPYHHTVYAEHSLKQHHTGLPVYSTETNKPYHHALYAEHSLEHHHMALPVNSAEPHKQLVSYVTEKKPIHFVPVAKHFSHVEHIAPKYVAPAEHKDETSISHIEIKSTPNTHNHAKTHVSFHGVNAKYEY